MRNWIRHVRRGDFAAIPEDLGFNNAAKLALLVDGYDLTGGVTECFAISQRVVAEFRSTASTTATALDLWIALFGMQRGYRFCGLLPEGEDLHVLDLLVEALRDALLALKPTQRAGIISLIVSERVEERSSLFDE